MLVPAGTSIKVHNEIILLIFGYRTLLVSVLRMCHVQVIWFKRQFIPTQHGPIKVAKHETNIGTHTVKANDTNRPKLTLAPLGLVNDGHTHIVAPFFIFHGMYHLSKT